MSNVITHSVFFTLRHPEGSSEETAFLNDGHTILSAIPGVEAFEVLKEVSPKNDYRFGFSMRFKDQATYEAYSSHPDHDAFVEDRWKREVTDFLEIDHVKTR